MVHAKVGNYSVKHSYSLIVNQGEHIELRPFGDLPIFLFKFVEDTENTEIRWVVTDLRDNGCDITLYNHQNITTGGTTQENINLGKIGETEIYARYHIQSMAGKVQTYLFIICFGEVL